MNKALLSEENLEDIKIKYYELKLSLTDIGKLYNVSYYTVMRFLDKYGYIRRTREEGLNTEKCIEKIRDTAVKRWEDKDYKNNQISKRINKPSGAKNRTWKIADTTTYIRYGNKNNNWKGGKTKLIFLIRGLEKYQEWRNYIFERDNYTCQKCGRRSCKGDKVEIHADHIIPLSFIISKNKIEDIEESLNCSEIWDVDNGRTLCKECHKNTDTFGVNANYYSEACGD